MMHFDGPSSTTAQDSYSRLEAPIWLGSESATIPHRPIDHWAEFDWAELYYLGRVYVIQQHYTTQLTAEDDDGATSARGSTRE
eukprot:scaffold20816_cov18-Prasinocladus_malaysianus.AAC.1